MLGLVLVRLLNKVLGHILIVYLGLKVCLLTFFIFMNFKLFIFVLLSGVVWLLEAKLFQLAENKENLEMYKNTQF